MKLSESIFNKLMEQYLNDIKSFGEEEDILLCENLFNKTKKLLTESKKNNGFKILTESITNNKENELVKDFKLYVKLVFES